ncbi:hypothetical protein N8J89_40190 [Crossiella sp. CA-258035]|uniref:hypothetical protein n=1 Tax=Crossiella sp. CA-258035 TaxID=2981138 RepID=UPI0024BBFF44|nr:hypothetical protein [Crossiella sp. CA-258035]WHT19239.1 hypothetical protein N8J89_40190 [Crossiella sp. CA-258035]
MPSGELRASELRSVLAAEAPPPTVSCADVVRDGRRVVRRRRFGVALVLTAVLALLGTGTVALLPVPEAEPAAMTTPPPSSVTTSPAPLFPPMTVRDAEFYTGLLAKQRWLPKGYTAISDSQGKPGTFQVVGDIIRMGARITDTQGRSGSLVIVVRPPTGHPISCDTADGCRSETLRPPEFTRFSWPRKADAAVAEREVLVIDKTGGQVSAVVTDSPAWPILSGAEIAELTTNLALLGQLTQR